MARHYKALDELLALMEDEQKQEAQITPAVSESSLILTDTPFVYDEGDEEVRHTTSFDAHHSVIVN